MPTATKPTTATKPVDKGTIADLEVAHEQLGAAREERAGLGVGARKHETELAQADAELRHLARTDRDQFGPDGLPRAKTQAARLKAKLERAGSSKWGDVLSGSDEQIRRLEDQVHRLTDENAVELAHREYRAGENDLAEVDGLADQMLAALSSLEGRRARLIQIAAASRGRINGTDIWSDERLDQLRHLLSEHADFAPPRSRTLTPLIGENPSVVRGKGGWISAGHGSDNYGEQPPRIEAGR